LVEKDQRPIDRHYDQVLAAAVSQIGEQGARGIVQYSDSGFFGDIFEGTVAAVAVETIGKRGRLANIDIVEAVAIHVSNCNPVVAVNVDAAGAVE